MEEQAIHEHPRIQGGVSVFPGTRVPVKNLFDYLESGESLEQFLSDFPAVDRAKAIAALESAREALDRRLTRREAVVPRSSTDACEWTSEVNG